MAAIIITLANAVAAAAAGRPIEWKTRAVSNKRGSLHNKNNVAHANKLARMILSVGLPAGTRNLHTNDNRPSANRNVRAPRETANFLAGRRISRFLIRLTFAGLLVQLAGRYAIVGWRRRPREHRRRQLIQRC